MPRSASSHTTYIALTEAEYSRQLEQAARRGAEHALREKGLDAADLTTQAALRQGVLTRTDLMRWVDVSADTVRRWEKAGLPHKKLGQQVFYHVDDLAAWLFSHRHGDAETSEDARHAARTILAKHETADGDVVDAQARESS